MNKRLKITISISLNTLFLVLAILYLKDHYGKMSFNLYLPSVLVFTCICENDIRRTIKKIREYNNETI